MRGGRRGEAFLNKAYAVLMIVLIGAVIALHQGRVLGHDLFASHEVEKVPATYTLDDVQSIFAKATSFELVEDSILVYHNQQNIGWAFNTSPTSDSIVGFASSVPLLVGYDNSNLLVGLQLLENYESPDFVSEIVGVGYTERWNGLSMEQVMRTNIDAVSGATMTSTAIAHTLRHGTSRFFGPAIALESEVSFMSILKMLSGYVLLLCAVIQFFAPKRFKRFRTVYKILIVAVLGLWSGSFLSFFAFYNWTINGLDITAKLFTFFVLVLSIVLPLTTGKAFYCSYLCPFGASQDLLGKVTRHKIKLTDNVKQFLSTLREKVFATIVLLLMVGVSFDLTNVEPFSAFLYKTAGIPIIILALSFLLLSIFIPRPWCKYACPTGQLLEIFRKPIKK